MNRRILLTFLALAFFTFGCATSPKLETYPRNHYERPYSLPEKVMSWGISASYSGIVQGDDGADGIGLPIPTSVASLARYLSFRYGFTDDWTVIFSPLPLGVSRGLVNSADDRAGFSLGINNVPFRGGDLDPWMSASWLHRFDSDFGWSTHLNLSVVRSSSANALDYYFAVATGPVWKVGQYSQFDIGLLCTTRPDAGGLSRRIRWDDFSGEQTRRPGRGIYASFGPQFSFSTSMTRHWDFFFENTILYDNSFRSFSTGIGFSRQW